MKIEKYYLNLAGEYRVCAELLKRNVFAAITFGNMKGADIIAVGSNRRAAVIEVKASNSTRFVTGFYQKYETPDVAHPEFWVLYSVQPNGDSHMERFFVLSHDEMAAIQAQVNQREGLSYIECAKKSASGVDNVRVQHVESFEDKWHKIVDWCSTMNSGVAGASKP